MTDLLTPENTGEIQRDPGMTTQNLAPYADLPPALRRPTVEVPAITDLDTSPQPDPLPPPPPPAPGYVGRHRAADDLPADLPPGRFAAVRSVLRSAWARVRGSM